MDENRYGVWIFILSLFALVISTSFFTINFLEKSGKISDESIPYYLMSSGFVGFAFWGWALGLALAMASLVMTRRVRYKLVKIVIWVFSSLSIIAALSWAFLIFFLMWMLGGTT